MKILGWVVNVVIGIVIVVGLLMTGWLLRGYKARKEAK